jgi:hypothetical protein
MYDAVDRGPLVLDPVAGVVCDGVEVVAAQQAAPRQLGCQNTAAAPRSAR